MVQKPPYLHFTIKYCSYWNKIHHLVYYAASSNHWLPTQDILHANSSGFFQKKPVLVLTLAKLGRTLTSMFWRLLTCVWRVWWWRGSRVGPPRTRRASRPQWSWRSPPPPPPQRHRWLWPCIHTCSGWTARRSARPLRCCSPPLWAWPRPQGTYLQGVKAKLGRSG